MRVVSLLDYDVDPERDYAISGDDLHQLQKVIKRMYAARSLKPGEMLKMAKILDETYLELLSE